MSPGSAPAWRSGRSGCAGPRARIGRVDGRSSAGTAGRSPPAAAPRPAGDALHHHRVAGGDGRTGGKAASKTPSATVSGVAAMRWVAGMVGASPESGLRPRNRAAGAAVNRCAGRGEAARRGGDASRWCSMPPFASCRAPSIATCGRRRRPSGRMAAAPMARSQACGAGAGDLRPQKEHRRLPHSVRRQALKWPACIRWRRRSSAATTGKSAAFRNSGARPRMFSDKPGQGR